MCSFVYSLLAAISHFLGHFGSSFKLSICYTKGAHLFTHRWLQLVTFWGISDSVSNCQYATPRGLIRLLTAGCNYSQIRCLWINSHWIGCCWAWIHCLVPVVSVVPVVPVSLDPLSFNLLCLYPLWLDLDALLLDQFMWIR